MEHHGPRRPAAHGATERTRYMGVMGRIPRMRKSKASAALDRAEDPRETLDHSYELQVEHQQKVRRGVADVATAHKRLELQVVQHGDSASALGADAREAVSIGREDLAREALTRKRAVESEIDSITVQRDQLAAELEKLVASERRVAARVEESRGHKEVVKATCTSAE